MKFFKKIVSGLFLSFLIFAPFISRAFCVPIISADLCKNASKQNCLDSNLCVWSSSYCIKSDKCGTYTTDNVCNDDKRCTSDPALVNNDYTIKRIDTTANLDFSGADQPAPQMDNPISSISSPQILIGKIINSILGIVGSLALIMFIYGGFTWMTSGGNAENTKKGKDIIVWSALGLAVIFLSYGLVKYLILNIK